MTTPQNAPPPEDTMKSRSQTFSDLIASRQLVVCAGSGGVGKTTTSAVIGLDAAIKGRKVLVLTIDPAKRLANSLGVDTLDDAPQQIPLGQFEQVGVEAKGELWAMMLDMKKSFDHLVNRYSANEENRQEILNNKIYKYFSTSLAGTQEYAAAERLLELRSEEHTSELQSRPHLVCRLLLEKKKKKKKNNK